MRKNVIYTFVLGLLCIGCSKQEIKFDIEKEKYYEYGTSISLDADDYLIFDECSEKEKQKVLEQAKVKIIGLENEEGKTYPKINNYIIQICYKDKILETKVIVDDKTKPTIDDIKDIHLKQNQQNYDFSKHIQVRDLQKVNLEFQTKAIDFTKPGKYKMKVVATDASQNKSEKDVIVYVDKEEKKPPVVNNKPITTPKEEVKTKYFGTTGNKQLDETCDRILDRIIKKSMDQKQQAYAVYQWVEHNIRYSGTTKEGNWKDEAFKILKYRKGNCLAFCYSSEALLTRLNIENIEVHDNGFTHYWNMVKINNQWYHFDATTGWGTERFLWTNQQLKEYSYNSPGMGMTINYEWDETLYPMTP